MVVSLQFWALVVTCLASLAVATVAWKHRDRPAGLPLVVLAIAAAGMAFLPGIPARLFGWEPALGGVIAQYLFIDIFVVAWVFLAVEYSNRRFEWLPGFSVALTLPLFHQLLQWSYPLYRYVTAEPVATISSQSSLFALVYAVVLCAALAAGIAVVFDEFRHARGIYRRQSLALLGAMCLFFSLTVIELLDLLAISNLLTYGGPLLTAVLLWALFYADFLEVATVARHRLVEEMDDAMVVVNDDRRLLDFNQSAMTLFDLDAGDLGDAVDEAFDSYPGLCTALESTDSKGTELTVDHAGDTRTYHLILTPVVDSGRPTNDQPLARTAVLRDITEKEQQRRELDRHREELETQNEKLLDQREELARKNEQLDRFRSMVSHDIRNPLNVALTRISLTRENEELEHLESAERSMKRIERMIDELMAIATPGEEVDRSDLAQHDLGELAETAWDYVEAQGATLTVEDSTSVLADDRRMLHLLENFFRNAIDHNEAPVSIRVGLLEEERGFFVSDDGIGIPEETREQAFEFGYSGRSDGTGFGLGIVKEMVGAHGWEITVTEDDTGGARFEIAFDRSASQSE